ncbi:MAG TPA: CDP-diacylglycerol--serine O-phosphatidyltransferase [Blastocatellia bacterium]|nr:CDP-diacylglycerol--serine O-phosphatidyltransferase [Blastocatellia bacterium]
MNDEKSAGDESGGHSAEARPPRRGIRRGIYLLPSALTIGNIVCGFYAVINSAKGYRVLDHPDDAARLFDNAARAIGYAVLLDGLDGRIARLTGATSEFGVELDSIADVISFGIAPALLAFTWGYGSTPGLERLSWAASFFFVICGALRLARFNVLARAPRFSAPGASPKLDKRYFVGLPIPAAAGLIAGTVHFFPAPLFPVSSAGHLSDLVTQAHRSAASWILIFVVAALSVLMVSTLRYTSFKSVGARSNKPFIILPLLALLVYGILFYSEWVLLTIALLYVLHGPAIKLGNLLNRLRRSGPHSSEDPASTTTVEM